MGLARKTVVLASASVARRRMLEAAGISIEVDPASLDEEEIKRAFRASDADAAECAEALAGAKALRGSARRPEQLVIGADQVLVCSGRFFDKPTDRLAAAAQLKALAGRKHELISAAAVAMNGAVIWRHTDRAVLTMRPFGEDFIREYLDAGGEAVLRSVGGYQLEGIGAHLFERVDGDFFTVLGLPLLPLLAFLRDRGAIPR